MTELLCKALPQRQTQRLLAKTNPTKAGFERGISAHTAGKYPLSQLVLKAAQGRVQHQLLVTDNCYPHPKPHTNARTALQSLGTRGFLPCPGSVLWESSRNPIPAARKNARCIYHTLLGNQRASLAHSWHLGNFVLNLLRVGPHFLLWVFKVAKKTSRMQPAKHRRDGADL